MNQVVGHLKKGEIQGICEKETDLVPGTRGYIAGYQKALATVMEGLSPAEMAHFEAQAKEWTNKCPPIELQQR